MGFGLSARQLKDKDYSDVKPELVGKALNYPNPFELSEGTDIYYRLSKPMTIELHVYDIFGRRLLESTFKAGEQGGQIDNEVRFDRSTVNGFDLSASVYFYYLIHEGTVLGKGKMAIIP